MVIEEFDFILKYTAYVSDVKKSSKLGTPFVRMMVRTDLVEKHTEESTDS